MYDEKVLEEKFGVEDVEKMLKCEEDKMISGKTKYYTLEDLENFARQVMYG